MNPDKRPRSLATLILPSLVLLFSGEILWRRLIVGQIPTQFSALFVYGLLILNVFYFGRELRIFLRSRTDVTRRGVNV